MVTPARVAEMPSRDRCIDPIELRRICELDLLVPPSQEEAAECLAAWVNCDPGWARAFLLLARVEQQKYLSSVLARLGAFDPADRDGIARIALEARVAALCGELGGPEPLVLSLRDGSVIVADLAGAALHRFDAVSGSRWSRVTWPGARLIEHRCAPVPGRRAWWRWWL